MIYNTIKIAHAIGSLQYGGAENQVVKLLNGLDDSKFEKTLIVFKNVRNANYQSLKPNTNYICIALKKWGHIQCIYRLYRYLKIQKIDLVQSHMFKTNLLVAIAAFFANVPVVIATEHGKNLWKKSVHHFLEARIISPVTRMRVAVSEDIRTLRLKFGDVPDNKITVIPNCVDIPRLINSKRKREVTKIGTVGRLVEPKDYTTLVKAFKIIIDKRFDANLIFVGDGPERSKLEALAKNLGISDRVSFLGFRSDVNALLRKFDIFALSSIREGIPVSMLEAMAMGVPVVATKVGGIPEVIRDNIHGLLTNSRDPDMMANAIKRLIENETLKELISKNGRDKVMHSFSSKIICGKYEKLYNELLSQG